MAAFDDYLQGNSDDSTSTVDPLTVTAATRIAAPDLSVQPGPATQMDFTPMPGTVSKGADQTAQPADINYNNNMQAGAISDALSGEPPLRGGSANPGLYGILPQGLQHGTLRNMLGALGDAFLVGGGGQAQYGPRMQRQEIGQAMAGYDPTNPQAAQAAIQRIAATGAAGSPEMADKLEQNFQSAQLRAQLMQQTIQSRNNNLLNRMNPVAQVDLAQATSPEDYANRLDRWNKRLKTIDPSLDAVGAFGVPDQYAPGALSATSGMTSNQVIQHGDRQSQQDTSRRNTDINAASRVQAAGIGANSRNYNTDVNADKSTSSSILQGLIDKQNKGETLTPAEQATFDHMTQVNKKGRSLPAGLITPGGGSGGKPVPTASDHAYARAHPEARAAFQAHFGVAP